LVVRDGWMGSLLLTRGFFDAQTTKAEAPKGLAASRFANTDNDDTNEGQPSSEGEAEQDHSSAALASVRSTLAYHAQFL